VTRDIALAAPQAVVPRAFAYERLVEALFVAFIFFGMMSVIEPSPYDFLTLLAVPAWFLGGFKLHQSAVPILLLWIVFEVAGFLSLMPHWDDAEARLYQFQSLYLFVTVVFFTIFFGERTLRRSDLCLRAFTAGAVVSAIVGIAGYVDFAGLGPILTTVEGRVSGTFKDPNVFGSYLILAATFLMQRILLGTSKHMLLTACNLFIVIGGVFVSYSRGSWGATILALITMTVAAFFTAETPRVRRRIAVTALAVVAVAGLGVLLALSDENVRDFFFQRATLLQDYDEGATGRFGNQIRSLPMLLDLPEGFGPLRFRRVFDLEPHNSYIGAFANDGWIGGFAWIWIVLMTGFVGFRLMFVASPYRRLAQVFWPALFSLLLQGFQIDVDHWRQLFLCCGAVWGLEAARLRWLAKTPTEARAPAVAS
jgi:hypothetical protein